MGKKGRSLVLQHQFYKDYVSYFWQEPILVTGPYVYVFYIFRVSRDFCRYCDWCSH